MSAFAVYEPVPPQVNETVGCDHSPSNVTAMSPSIARVNASLCDASAVPP